MKAYEDMHLVLSALADMEQKYEFIDETDVEFLNDYFTKYQHLILLREILEDKDHFVYDYPIQDEILDGATKSARRASKKVREAAKLAHILKKEHFKALFKCMKVLNNDEHIPVEYEGSLCELNIILDEHDGNKSEVSYEDDESLESDVIEDISDDNYNLPPYDNARYKEKKISQISVEKSKMPPYENVRLNERKGYPDNSDYQTISVHKDGPLGITVVQATVFYGGKTVNGCAIERILVNSLIDKQGLMQVGDIILEVNDEPMENPDDLRNFLDRCNGTVTFKIAKSINRPLSNVVNREKIYVRALFDYDPSQDNLLPSEEIGLSFKAGDVFEVLNRDDIHFWQALPLDSIDNQAFLIPSLSLQERLISLQTVSKSRTSVGTGFKGLRRKSKKNEIFRAKDAADLVSDADLKTYEDVVRFGPSRVPLVLLIGPSGVGKRAIKHLLVTKEPYRFSFPILDTSETKKSRNQPLFNHVDKTAMLNDIRASEYVCLEEKSSELYGVKKSAIKDLINHGKTVVLDCHPKDVYNLRIPMFNPYVILIAAPSLIALEAMQKEGLQKNLTKNKRSTSELQDIIKQSNEFQEIYKHLINRIVVCEDIQETSTLVSSLLSDFENSPSWIPASWEFDITPLSLTKPVDNKISKQNANVNISITNQRRYEKKSEKPSVSIIKNERNEQSLSESETESNSEENFVMAKPVKLLQAKKPEDASPKFEEKPIKHSIFKKSEDPKKEKSPKNSVSKVSKDTAVVVEEKSKKQSISRRPENVKSPNEDKLAKQGSVNKPDDITIKKEPIKHSNSKKTEDAPNKTREKSIEISQPSIKINMKGGASAENTRPILTSNKSGKEPIIHVKPKIDSPDASVKVVSNKNKTPEIKHEENVNNSNKSKPAPVAPPKNYGRMKIVQRENSSSGMSDTSSDSEVVMKVNRV